METGQVVSAGPSVEKVSPVVNLQARTEEVSSYASDVRNRVREVVESIVGMEPPSENPATNPQEPDASNVVGAVGLGLDNINDRLRQIVGEINRL